MRTRPLVTLAATVENEKGHAPIGFSYDGNGNLRTMTDPRTGPGAAEETVRHEYGVLDRLARTTWKGFPYPRELPSLTSVAYAYTGNGQLLTATETKETAAGPVDEVTARAYDGLERQESETRYDGKVVATGYDAKGNRTLVRDPDGVETAYGYDAQDRLRTATTPAGTGTATYRYWPDGLQKGLSLPNGLDEGRCYDAAGRLVELSSARGTVADDCTTSGQPLTSYVYAHDPNGNQTSQTEQRTDPATQVLGAIEETSYGYDELDRLVGVNYPDGNATLYRLDPVGNRTGERKTLASRVAALTVAAFAAVQPADAMVDVAGAFNRADWLLARTDAADASRDVAFGYDLDGNQTSKTRGGVTRELRWDGRNTLVAVFDAGVETGRYDYDRNLQRVKRRTATEDVAYVLDDRYVLQEASGTTGASTRRYHYGKQALQVTDPAGTTFLLVDALGSTTDQTTTSGTVYQARKHDAWGQYRNGTAPAANQPKLGYTGHQYDPETGLTYARARYYDADAGVFLSRDTYEGAMEDAPSLHRYAYAKGNPTAYRDEDGRSATVVGGITGFFWGFGQMVGGMANDAIDGRIRGTGDYLGLWGQNIVAGVELGASIDVCALSGGLAASACGALGMAGFDALTLGGQGRTASEFAQGQAEEGAKGAILGPIVSKVAPYVGKAAGYVLRQAEKVPGVKFVEEKAVQAVGNAARKVTDSFVVAEADQQAIQAADQVLQEQVSRAVDVAKVTRDVLREAWRDARTPWTGPLPVPEGTPVATAWSQAGRARHSAPGALTEGSRITDNSRLLPSATGSPSDMVVIGRQVDTAVAEKWPGHKVLNIDNWTLARNDSFIAEAIRKRQSFYLASPVSNQTLWNPARQSMSVFGRELGQIYQAGYVRVGDLLVPPVLP